MARLVLSGPSMQQRDWLSHSVGDVGYVTSRAVDATGIVVHGVTTRAGTLNLSFRTEPDPNRVRRSRTAACEAFGATPDNLVIPEQVHACGVAVVSRSHGGSGALDPDTAVADVDALVTADPDVLLGITIADCLPVFLVDPVNRAVGLAHSGWRGTCGEIVPNMLRLMRQEFDTEASRVLAAVGPGIQGMCYEVDDRVRDAFPARLRNAFRPSRPGHGLLDLRAAVVEQLRQCGTPAPAIDVCDDCTHCRSDLFFSHRGEGPGAGRMGAFIRLTGE